MSAKMKLPTGFRFRPTQKELIFYLRNWVSDKEIPHAAGVRSEDMYGEEEPWEMWERWAAKEDGEAVYVLTKLKIRGSSQTISRGCGKSGGSWHADGNGGSFSVEVEGGESLDCSKKGYTYKNKSSSSDSSNQFRWVMKEYSCSSLSRDRVICKLRRKELVVNGDASSSGVMINHGVLDKNPGPEMVMPPGVRFYPTKEELVGYYLYNMVTKGKASSGGNGVVNECDLYGTEEPWEVWDRFSKEGSSSSSSKDLYFFTKLKRRTPTDERIRRRVGDGGTWKRGVGTSFKVKIMISDESNGRTVLSGEKTLFGYRTEKKSSDRGKWTLHEYSCQELSKEVVVGVLRNRGGGAVKEEEPSEDDDDLDTMRKKMKKGIGGSVEEEGSSAKNDVVVDLDDDPERRMNVAGAVKLKCDDLDTKRKKMKKGIGSVEEEEGTRRHNDDVSVDLVDAERRMNDVVDLDDPERMKNVAGDVDIIEDGEAARRATLEGFKKEGVSEDWLKL